MSQNWSLSKKVKKVINLKKQKINKKIKTYFCWKIKLLKIEQKKIKEIRLKQINWINIAKYICMYINLIKKLILQKLNK